MAARMKTWKTGSGTFRMNVALSKLPEFSALPAAGDHHTAGIILAPSLAYGRGLSRASAWLEPGADYRNIHPLRRQPRPPGAHVASLFCQHVTPQFSDGSSWEEHRETVADLMIDTVGPMRLASKRA
jgi:phytoene dehydrogenase-like protein